MEAGQTFQGVETASQIRYVGYFEQIKYQFEGRAPESRSLTLKTVKIFSIKGRHMHIHETYGGNNSECYKIVLYLSLLGVGRGNGSDLSMTIVENGQEIFHCKFAEGVNCKVFVLI